MGTGLQAWRTLITSLFHRFPDRTSCHVPLRNSSKVSVCIHLSSWRLGRRAHAHATAKRPPRALCRHSEGERNERQASSPDCRRRDGRGRHERKRAGEGGRTRPRPRPTLQRLSVGHSVGAAAHWLAAGGLLGVGRVEIVEMAITGSAADWIIRFHRCSLFVSFF